MRTLESAEVEWTLDVESIREVLREHPVRLAILFGSHATGSTRGTSDVDIAVELEGLRATDEGYNEAFLGLSADLSEALDTDDVDLVDIHAASPGLVNAIFETGVILVGEQSDAVERYRQLRTDQASESPRDRLDDALARIDAHLGGGSSGVPVVGEGGDDG